MKKLLYFTALAVLVLSAASCSKTRAEQMAMADGVQITCDPEVLQIVGDKVPATISVTYPEGYFHPEALLVVTPVLVYDGGTLTGESVIYQGEKVRDNNRVIPSEGGTVTLKSEFAYVKGVENCRLELQSVAFYGTSRIEIPAVKVADGCVATSKLVDLSGVYNYKKDEYQYVIHKTAEGQILYDVNSSQVKGSELRSRSIRELQAALAEIMDDDRYTVTGTQIIAYASPEGGQELNAKLSDNRASTAQQAWGNISRDLEASGTEVRSIGQDWEGFQEAVSSSNIEDKDLILRVLSMYSDPAVRESEIRNMSQVYTEINQKVFPELRRARFVTSVDFQNFTDEELQELSEQAISMLDEEALLRVAANTEDPDRKRQLYRHAEQAYGSERAKYNIAMISLDQNEPSVAEYYLDRIESNDPDIVNARGVAALKRGKTDVAYELFQQAGTPEALCNMGAIDIARGNYAQAVQELADDTTSHKALALLLSGDIDAASAALTGDDATSDYLRAVIAARKGDADAVKANLDSACEKDASLKERAATDIEFAKYR